MTEAGARLSICLRPRLVSAGPPKVKRCKKWELGDMTPRHFPDHLEPRPPLDSRRGLLGALIHPIWTHRHAKSHQAAQWDDRAREPVPGCVWLVSPCLTVLVAEDFWVKIMPLKARGLGQCPQQLPISSEGWISFHYPRMSSDGPFALELLLLDPERSLINVSSSFKWHLPGTFSWLRSNGSLILVLSHYPRLTS